MVLDGRRMREDDLGARARELRGEHGRIGELARGARPRDVALALPRDGQERMRLGRAAATLGGEPGDPQRVERLSGGFEQADDLNRRRRRFGLEHARGELRAQRGLRLRPRHSRVDDAQRRELGERLVPRRLRLMLGAVECASPGPAEGGKPRAPRLRVLTG